jgi:predicted transcriptional regulator
MKAPKKRPLGIRLDPSLFNRVELLAQKTQRTINQVAALAVQDGIGNLEGRLKNEDFLPAGFSTSASECTIPKHGLPTLEQAQEVYASS